MNNKSFLEKTQNTLDYKTVVEPNIDLRQNLLTKTYPKFDYYNQLNTLNPLNNLVNINFLRKERLYTKLKYSRSPAFDIVSGGSAALLAGLIGFLISEKFGMELVDSGDFYYLMMYGVFLVFSIKPLLVIMDHKKNLYYLLSLNRVLEFYINVIKLFLYFFYKK
jgi:hypothetical protein